MTDTREKIAQIIEEQAQIGVSGDAPLDPGVSNAKELADAILAALPSDGWRDPSEVPVMKNRTELDIIVCREREGKRYVFPGLYLKDHQLSFDEEPWEREVTGFYYREDQEEGCPYYKMDDLVSKFVGWQYLPQPPAQSEAET